MFGHIKQGNVIEIFLFGFNFLWGVISPFQSFQNHLSSFDTPVAGHSGLKLENKLNLALN
jgi:hypothetical protein